MKSIKDYAVLLGVISAVIALVQIIASVFNLGLDINLIVETISIILAVLVTVGVINKKDSANKSIKDLQEDIKNDLIDSTNQKDEDTSKTTFLDQNNKDN